METILDTSILIASERRRESVSQILHQVQAVRGEVDISLFTISVVELTHGIFRARTEAERARRRIFADAVFGDIIVHPVTLEIAQLAGQIEGEQMARGVSIAFEDLLIGTTALHLGCDVVTLNLRHFQKIPGLRVVSL